MSEVVGRGGAGGGGVAECMDEYVFMCVYPFCRSDCDSPEVRQGAAEGIFSDGDGH